MSYTIALVFFIALICPLIQNVGITILLARGQQRFRSIVYLGIAVVSLICQILVTPGYGAVGCAVVIGLTLFVGQWVVMNIYYKSRQRIDICEFWREIGKMAICPIILTGLSYWLAERIDLNSWLSIGIAGFAFCIVYISAFFCFSMNKYEQETTLAPLRVIGKRLGL